MPFTIKTLTSSNPSQKPRRNSTKMSSSQNKNNQPAMLAYRDENNTSIKYAPATTDPQIQHSNDDSDAEALIPPAAPPSELSEHDKQHFTATGRPQPAFKASGLANLGGHMYTMPQLLPKRYTDDSIIPAIITDVIPTPKAPETETGGKKSSLLSKLKGGSKKDEQKDKVMKVVYMPRRDYQKWFARDEKGNYVGSEEHRRWTEEELEEAFKQYKPDTKEKKTGLLSGTGGGLIL
ncbi:hypothetical protein ONS95_005384 [Cadophora gregata]|uniref:uncharacterized protein n=1 Tax=Cadophora gregata TaxID=51156 RepID=UPI0026DC5A44|nr:uncharacterized protein ONS95_005384 [Cadophora gregata]KAK0103358.1 hypothetical protein ONS95_005384 [Cadophora gregata]